MERRGGQHNNRLTIILDDQDLSTLLETGRCSGLDDGSDPDFTHGVNVEYVPQVPGPRAYLLGDALTIITSHRPVAGVPTMIPSGSILRNRETIDTPVDGNGSIILKVADSPQQTPKSA